MNDGSQSAEVLQTARLSLRRPTEADVEAILAIHRDPETCVHNPSDALTRTLPTLEQPVGAVRIRVLGRPAPCC